MKYDLSKFPQRLRRARRTKGLSQRELTNLTKLSPQCISAYEWGARLPNILMLVILAENLGVSLEWLCGGEYNESDI